MIGRVALIAVLAISIVGCGPTPEEKAADEVRRGLHCFPATKGDWSDIDTKSEHKTVVFLDVEGPAADYGKMEISTVEDGIHFVKNFYRYEDSEWEHVGDWSFSSVECG